MEPWGMQVRKYRCVQNFGGVEVVKCMRNAPNLGALVNRAAKWLRDRVVLLVCDDLWASVDNELGYVLDLCRKRCCGTLRKASC